MNSRLPVCLLILASLLASQLTLAHHLVEHIHDLGAPEIHLHSVHEGREAHQAYSTHKAHQAHKAHKGHQALEAHQAHSAHWAPAPSTVTAAAEKADHADELCAICLMYSTMQGCSSQPESSSVASMASTAHPPVPAFLRAKPRCASSAIRAPPAL